MKFIATDEAPKAIGPYSQAVEEGGLLFASGQIPLDPATGELVSVRSAPVRRRTEGAVRRVSAEVHFKAGATVRE